MINNSSTYPLLIYSNTKKCDARNDQSKKHFFRNIDEVNLVINYMVKFAYFLLAFAIVIMIYPYLYKLLLKRRCW